MFKNRNHVNDVGSIKLRHLIINLKTKLYLKTKQRKIFIFNFRA